MCYQCLKGRGKEKQNTNTQVCTWHVHVCFAVKYNLPLDVKHQFVSVSIHDLQMIYKSENNSCHRRKIFMIYIFLPFEFVKLFMMNYFICTEIYEINVCIEIGLINNSSLWIYHPL